jgi:hypothetical protein
VNLVVIIGSWALLAAALLKARQMAARAASATTTTTTTAPTSAAASAVPAPAPPAAPDVIVWGRLGASAVEWRLGEQVLAGEAEVVAHPTDQRVVGLRNLSGRPWTAAVSPGTEQIVQPGQSLRLAPGVRLVVGSTALEIERVR